MANVVPVHTKDKKNYRLISYYLTSFFSKITERVIHNSLLIHFVSIKLFTPSQFGFLPRDSYITQILTINFEIPPLILIAMLLLSLEVSF